MTTAIFLGAGASAAEGAPLQSNLFRDYFKSVQNTHIDYPINLMEGMLPLFFQDMFGINILDDNLDKISFPTFEEVLGILDLAEIKNESFNVYRIPINQNEIYIDIRVVRSRLIKIMGLIIKERLVHSKNIHRALISKLASANILEETIFLSTNYDILIDNALIDQGGSTKIDYCIDFANSHILNSQLSLQPQGVKLFKLHGSLNWLYCSTCNNLKLTPFEKSATEDFLKCEECRSIYGPIIIPPTYFKNMSNTFISQVWNKAENFCRKVDEIIFCGYSFPDADIHVKYLLKRIETNGNSRLRRIKVFNSYDGKKTNEKIEEKKRYKRFFKVDVSYENVSFEDFARNPVDYL